MPITEALWRRYTKKWCAHSDLRRYGRTPWCAAILVCAERALVRHHQRMEVYSKRRPASGRSRLAQPPSGAARRRTRADFHVPSLSNAHELGDMRSPCSPPCPPLRTYLERVHGGRQLVPRRVQVACTIASMGQTGADASGLTRTCAVVANCHHRATCGFAPTCRAVTAGRSPASGANPDTCGGANLAPPRDLAFYRTTDTPLARSRSGNKPDNNGSAKLAEPYDLGRYPSPSADRPKPDNCGPADLAGPHDLHKCSRHEPSPRHTGGSCTARGASDSRISAVASFTASARAM